MPIKKMLTIGYKHKQKLIKNIDEKPIDFAIVPISENENAYSLEVAREMREKGKSALVVASSKKLGDKMKYASKLAKNAIVIGDAEVATKKYKIKEFK